ncbi:hypothetical protein VCHENC02_2973B, partial [Vibrio harveyi]
TYLYVNKVSGHACCHLLPFMPCKLYGVTRISDTTQPKFKVISDDPVT